MISRTWHVTVMNAKARIQFSSKKQNIPGYQTKTLAQEAGYRYILKNRIEGGRVICTQAVGQALDSHRSFSDRVMAMGEAQR